MVEAAPTPGVLALYFFMQMMAGIIVFGGLFLGIWALFEWLDKIMFKLTDEMAPPV